MKDTRSFSALTYLSSFGFAVTVPLLLLLGGLLFQSASRERAELQDRVSQVRDALVNDIDRELDRDITILNTLATSQALATADWPTFYSQAKAGLQGRAYLVLVDSNGRQLVNTYVPYGQQPAMTGDPDTLRKILQIKEPAVSNLFVSFVVKKPVFNVSIPILQDGDVRYVMSLGLLPDDLVALLTSQKLDPQWVTLIWDAKGVILARSQNNARYVSTPLPESMRELHRDVVRTINLDGTDVLHATARSRIAGWGVGVNVPYSLITGQMRNSLLLWGTATVVALASALALGLFFARQITTSLSVAAEAAAAFGDGKRSPLTGSRIKEADAFLATLRQAQEARDSLTEEVKQGRDWLQTVLASIGDGVIATDQNGRITFLNGVSQTLTGWAQEHAIGRPIDEIFVIRSEQTGAAVENPAVRAMREGRIVGLANDTVLVARDGTQRPVDDSGCPIKDADGKTLGAVLIFRDVTERRRAERERAQLLEREQAALASVRQSEDRLRVTIASIGDAVIATDAHARITLLNPVAEALTGWSSADALGRPLHDVFVIVNEETRQSAANPVDRALRDGTIAALANHTILVSKDGRELPIDDSAAPVRADDGRIAGAVVVFRDITERRRSEREREARERTNRELASIVESTDDAIIGMTLDGDVTAWNPAAERMYGYGAAEMIGQSIRRIVTPQRWEEEHGILARIRDGTRVEHYETVRQRKDGSILPVSLTLSPIRNGAGDVIGISKIARDITARAQLEHERAAMLAREHDARIEIERASRLKDEFLAVLSHELRTPLNAVLGYAHLLGSGALPHARAQHAIAAIQRNAQAQARLVESLLDLSRVLAGKLELELRSQNLGAIVEAALEAVKTDADAKGVAFELSGTRAPIFVTGDATRLQQVFWNLFSNAVKFTPHGGRVSVRAATRDGMAVIEVADTGQGISAEFLPHVFDRFKQGDAGKHPRPGLGLGLAVVREMVQAHGGTIMAESRGPGLGATFRLTLPLGVGIAPHDTTASDLVGGTDESLAALDILIVDDDEDARDLFALILESRGARTRSAASAHEALEAIRERRPNLVLSDLRMPDEDGYFLIREVRSRDDGTDRVAAIAVTANASVKDRERALAAGYDQHVAKPVDPSELARLIVRLTSADSV